MIGKSESETPHLTVPPQHTQQQMPNQPQQPKLKMKLMMVRELANEEGDETEGSPAQETIEIMMSSK